MDIELVAYSQANPALNPADLLEMSDLATIWNGAGAFPENIIEYAGRVCYRSTHRMGAAPRFIINRVKEGHEDIIEHIVATVRVRNSEDPLRWRIRNRHCEVTQESDGSWLVSGNTRVWLDLFRQGLGLPALPFLQAIAPKVYAELADSASIPPAPIMPTPEKVVLRATEGRDYAIHNNHINHSSQFDRHALRPREESPLRVTLLAFTQPALEDAEAQLHHGSATFFFEGISRACTHQLVRHRLASFSQESQRYVGLDKGGWKVIIPPDIEGNEKTEARLNEAWDYLQQLYQELRQMGVRKEDARFLLPNATETRIVTTMNFAAWSHFLWLRAVDKAAQWEIRRLGQLVLEMLYSIAPAVFQEHWDVYQDKFVTPMQRAESTPALGRLDP